MGIAAHPWVGALRAQAIGTRLGARRRHVLVVVATVLGSSSTSGTPGEGAGGASSSPQLAPLRCIDQRRPAWTPDLFAHGVLLAQHACPGGQAVLNPEGLARSGRTLPRRRTIVSRAPWAGRPGGGNCFVASWGMRANAGEEEIISASCPFLGMTLRANQQSTERAPDGLHHADKFLEMTCMSSEEVSKQDKKHTLSHYFSGGQRGRRWGKEEFCRKRDVLGLAGRDP